MPLLCDDLRHLSLITIPGFHTFYETRGRGVKVRERLKISQPEGPENGNWASNGASFPALGKGVKIPFFDEHRETFMTSDQPCQKLFGPSGKENMQIACQPSLPIKKKRGGG